jgi:hypothetical protein
MAEILIPTPTLVRTPLTNLYALLAFPALEQRVARRYQSIGVKTTLGKLPNADLHLPILRVL